MTDQTLPVVRLRPKANVTALKRGYPWVFADEMVTDRRTRALPAGTIAELQDAERRSLGVAAVTPESKIIARMLDPDLTQAPDQAWFEARLTRALALRDRLFDVAFYRLVHAEADGLPGVIIDRFGDACVIQPNAAWSEVLLAPLTQALAQVTGCTTVLKNAGSRGRVLEGLDDQNAVLMGTAPQAPVQVPMNSAIYLADLTGGQKTGLFYDQRPNHAFVANLARRGTVLDVFSHVGGFALAALAAGATHALAVDGSAPALALAEDGARAMGQGEQFETQQGDAFETMAQLAEESRTFDTVICDPPAFVPHKKAVDAGLRAYERVARLAAPLVAENGILALCSCSHAADAAQFQGACLRGISRAGRKAQLIYTGAAGPDHPRLPQLPESGYLKTLVFRL